MSKIKDFFFDTISLSYSFSFLIYQVVRILIGVYAARLLGPEKFAPWNLIQPALLFGTFFFLGIPNGINRLVPYYIGNDNKIRAYEAITNTSKFSFNLLLILSILCIAIGKILIGSWVNTLILSVILILLWQYYVLSQANLRGLGLFKSLGLQYILFFVCYPVFFLALISYEIDGFIVANIVVTVIATTYNQCVVRRFLEKNGTQKHNFNLLSEIIFVGFPIMLIGMAFYGILNIDKFIIGKLVGAKGLGLYTLAAMGANLLLIVSGLIDQQFYIKLSREYGRFRSVRNLMNIQKKYLIINGLITFILVLFSQALIEPVVETVLPQYVGGINAARIILIGLVPLSMSAAIGTFLNSIGSRRVYLLSQIICLFLMTGTLAYVAEQYSSIEIIASCTSFFFMLYFLVLACIMVCCLRKDQLKEIQMEY